MDEPFTFPGEFPDCGCHYTTSDDGIHFCRLHKAAPDLLAAAKALMAGYEHGKGVVPHLPGLAAAIAKAEGRA